jgi:hypothetical protein
MILKNFPPIDGVLQYGAARWRRRMANARPTALVMG